MYEYSGNLTRTPAAAAKWSAGLAQQGNPLRSPVPLVGTRSDELPTGEMKGSHLNIF